MKFGPILGAQRGSNEPVFRFQNGLCARSGAQDGARRHHGTPKRPKCSPRPHKMERRALKTEPKTAPDPKIILAKGPTTT